MIEIVFKSTFFQKTDLPQIWQFWFWKWFWNFQNLKKTQKRPSKFHKIYSVHKLMYIHPTIQPPIHSSTHPPIQLSTLPLIHPSTHSPFRPSIYPPTPTGINISVKDKVRLWFLFQIESHPLWHSHWICRVYWVVQVSSRCESHSFGDAKNRY